MGFSKVFKVATLAKSSVALSALLLGGAAYAQAGQEAIDPNAPRTGAPIDTEIGDTAEELEQSATTGAEGTAEAGQIIVTGTLVRGVAPPGASPISVSDEDIQATGANTVAQVLQTIPQLGSFGGFQVPMGSTPEVTVNRPNLRGLSANTAGGSTTLVLLDGHRLVGMGSNTTSPDPDVIPPGVLQRLEIIPDGGSAIYGSDAVAGVLNFITISSFDGIRVDASYGLADDYHRYDVNVTAGRDWGDGSLYFSYNYAKGDDLFGIDRDFVRQFPDVATGRTAIECSPGNVQVGAVFYAQPGTTPGTLNQCDATDFSSFYPAYERHSVFGGLSQQLSDSLRIDLRAFYTTRDTEIVSGPYRFTQQLTAAQAAARAPAAYAGLGAQTVFGTFGDNDDARLDIGLEAWGITPTITADLGDNFQLRVLGSHGESTANRRGLILDTTALGVLVGTGAFNPYNPASASAATIASLTNLQNFGRTRQYLDNLRAVIDGNLFELPAGAVKIAVGGEYSFEKFVAQNGSSIPGTQNSGFAGNGINPARGPIPIYNLSRNIKSAFGELVVPVFGGGGPELTVSSAGRYDRYSDVGDTFNPRFGATFKPVEWVAIRGAWGKSFNAPSLADDPRASANEVFFLPALVNAGFRPPADLVANGSYPAFNGGGILAIRGNAPGIQPQEATNWTVGFDIDPPFIEGLSFGATYYNIDFKNIIRLPPFENADALYRFTGSVIRTGGEFTQADINAIVNADTDGIIAPFGSACPFGGALGGCNTVAGTYAIFDARKTNVSSVKVDGVDFRLSYERPFDFATVFMNVNGTYDISRDERIGTGPFQDRISKDANRFRVRSTLGATVGNLLGQVTWNHLAGYEFQAPQGFVGTPFAGSPFGTRTFVAQNEIGDFNTFDLFFKYDFKGAGMTEDLSLTLNVENLFDQDPPEFRGIRTGDAPGVLLGRTLGRLIQFGISKKL